MPEHVGPLNLVDGYGGSGSEAHTDNDRRRKRDVIRAARSQPARGPDRAAGAMIPRLGVLVLNVKSERLALAANMLRGVPKVLLD